MRLVSAIVAFCLAAVLLGAGIAQRTIFLAPDRVSVEAQYESRTPYTVLSPEVLAAHSGAVTITVSGPARATVAVGRLSDVTGWIGQTTYTQLDWDAQNRRVQPSLKRVAETASATPISGSSPFGSDLWIADAEGDQSAAAVVDDATGQAAIIAADGVALAPGTVKLTWAVDNSTPLAGSLITAGIVLFVLGGIFIWLTLRQNRRSRGPRRRGPSSPSSGRPVRSSRRGASRRELGPRGRRALGRLSIAALGGIILVGLTGCAVGPASTGSSALPTETVTASKPETGEPAVTVRQAKRILSRVAAAAMAADTAKDASKLVGRFAGPALEARQANYQVRARKADYPPPAAIPIDPLDIALPQQVLDSWPRVVVTVSHNTEDSTQAPVALVMIQETPRTNYHVYYSAALVPNVQTPEFAPANIGAPLIAPDSKLVELAPNQLASAYADVLNKDAKSGFAKVFSATGDSLREQLGKLGQDKIRAALPANSTISFAATAGSGPVIAMATNDSGALVAVQVRQVRRITPTGGGAVGFAQGSASAALSGFSGKSFRGVQSTSSLQLLVYIPAVGANETARVLGWSEALISASEIP